jgi:hypothetical protein
VPPPRRADDGSCFPPASCATAARVDSLNKSGCTAQYRRVVQDVHSSHCVRGNDDGESFRSTPSVAVARLDPDVCTHLVLIRPAARPLAVRASHSGYKLSVVPANAGTHNHRPEFVAATAGRLSFRQRISRRMGPRVRTKACTYLQTQPISGVKCSCRATNSLSSLRTQGPITTGLTLWHERWDGFFFPLTSITRYGSLRPQGRQLRLPFEMCACFRV